MNVIRYFYTSLIGIYIRKIFNTFRPTAWILGKIKSRRQFNEILIWKEGEYYKTDFYSELDNGGRVFVDYIQKNSEKNDSILDICCNQGRFLFDLQSKGYKRLYGFDIMDSAIKVLENNTAYIPNLMHVEHCLAQDYFSNKENGQFDWAITYSATIELIHPEFDIFKELSRTVKKGMFLVLNENGHSYPRFYRFLHRANGFKIVSITPIFNECVLIHSIRTI